MKKFAEIATSEDPRAFEAELSVAHDFIYRPLFLKLMQGIVGKSYGGLLGADCLFVLPARREIPQILSLLRWIFGRPESWEVEGPIEAFSLRLKRGASALEAGISVQAQAGAATGSGRFTLEGAEFSFILGERDALTLTPKEAPERIIPLPEGSGEYYAAMDEAECLKEGRASRIFPGKAALACALFLGELGFDAAKGKGRPDR